MTQSLPNDGAPPDDGAPPGADATAPDDPVVLVARIAESLPSLDPDGLERLAGALDELTEAVGLLMTVDEDQ